MSVDPDRPGMVPSANRYIGKTRGPVAVWLLSIVTLGIYYLVWYYKINREVRDFDPTIEVSPGMAVIAITFGAILLGIPPIVSTIMTGRRIAQAERSAGLPGSCSGVIGFLLSLVLGLNTIYYQAKLNDIWARY
jgi:uncharacterized membrane protein